MVEGNRGMIWVWCHIWGKSKWLMSSGRVFTLPRCKIFCEKYQQIVCIWFFAHVTKLLLAKLKKFQGSSFPKELLCDLFSTKAKRKIAIFKVLEHILESFQYFFLEFIWEQGLINFLLQKSKIACQCSSKPGNKTQSPDFGHFFYIFWNFSQCPFWQKSLT